MINRYSSRRTHMGKAFLTQKLKGATSYDRIAGYFCSSVLDIAGDEIESITGKARIICNSGLHPDDVKVSRLANQRIKQEWCDYKPEEKFVSPAQLACLQRLYDLLASGKLEIRVLPDEVFGLIHGKAGVITYPDGSRTSFVGSINETRNALSRNYEIVWEDPSPEAADWVQEEFDFFWNHKAATPLCDFVIQDIQRIAKRSVLSVDHWRETDDPDIGSVAAEEPVYRKDNGLWPHQKYFVTRAFKDHQSNAGAHLILADKVGLGKTLQLAMTAKLMALYGKKPILIIVPKAIMAQWQESINVMLDIPSAKWVGNGWMDENGTFYQNDIQHCPRRIGLVSQGIVNRAAKDGNGQKLLDRYGGYECIFVDEAHHARRNNLYQDANVKPAEPNNLLKFIQDASMVAHSVILATATPIQLDTIELFDLLDAISRPQNAVGVLGDQYSTWRKEPKKMLDMIAGNEPKPLNPEGMWHIMRDPLPLGNTNDKNASEIVSLRNFLLPAAGRVTQDTVIFEQSLYNSLPYNIQERIKRTFKNEYVEKHNPYIRNVVCRTRDLLENTINPETDEPYLAKIQVRLYGDVKGETIELPPFLLKAYKEAERFCELLGEEGQSKGFITSILLRRIGSTLRAGESTARKFLRWSDGEITEDDVKNDIAEVADEDEEDGKQTSATTKNIAPTYRSLSAEEEACLKRLIHGLESYKEQDPKYIMTKKLLLEGIDEGGPWLDLGCIIFSQFYDSAKDIAEKLHSELRVDNQPIPIGLYAGAGKSGIWRDGSFAFCDRELLKKMVRDRELKVLVGTDAASEGLDLQTMSTLINIDLPWNPTRLEQRKGRIQRIGQISDTIRIYNMRYKGSIEDTVFQRLSERFKNVYELFGQLPDAIEDIWVKAARNDIKGVEDKIESIKSKPAPFIEKYELNIPACSDWEKCTEVLDKREKMSELRKSW